MNKELLFRTKNKEQLSAFHSALLYHLVSFADTNKKPRTKNKEQLFEQRTIF